MAGAFGLADELAKAVTVSAAPFFGVTVRESAAELVDHDEMHGVPSAAAGFTGEDFERGVHAVPGQTPVRKWWRCFKRLRCERLMLSRQRSSMTSIRVRVG